MAVVNATSGTTLTRRLDLGDAFNEFLLDGDRYAARQVLPPIRVPYEIGTFPSWTRGDTLLPVNVKRFGNAAYSRSDVKLSEKTYTCAERGHEIVIGDKDERRYRGQANFPLNATRKVAHKVAIDAEVDTAAAIFNTTTWTGSTLYTDVTTVWTDIAATIKADIIAAKNKVFALTGTVPNTLIVNRTVMETIRLNTQLQNLIQYTRIGTYDGFTQAFLDIVGLKKVIVCNAVKNSANESATATLAEVWSASYAMVARIPETDDLAEPGLGRTMIWSEDDTGGTVNAGEPGAIVETYREEQQRGTVYRARQNTAEFVLDPSYAHLLKID